MKSWFLLKSSIFHCINVKKTYILYTSYVLFWPLLLAAFDWYVSTFVSNPIPFEPLGYICKFFGLVFLIVVVSHQETICIKRAVVSSKFEAYTNISYSRHIGAKLQKKIIYSLHLIGNLVSKLDRILSCRTKDLVKLINDNILVMYKKISECNSFPEQTLVVNTYLPILVAPLFLLAKL